MTRIISARSRVNQTETLPPLARHPTTSLSNHTGESALQMRHIILLLQSLLSH